MVAKVSLQIDVYFCFAGYIYMYQSKSIYVGRTGGGEEGGRGEGRMGGGGGLEELREKGKEYCVVCVHGELF